MLHTTRWDELLGSTIASVVGRGSGETRIEFLRAGRRRTAVVTHTRTLTGDRTPSGCIDRVTPVFTSTAAILVFGTDAGDSLTVGGGGAWLGD